MTSVTIYTDGGCDPNPGPGGWAAVLLSGSHRKELSGAEPESTNNRMELTAALRALQALKHPCIVTVITDSEYLKNGITTWLKGWRARGWKTADRRPVANQDLWIALDAAAAAHTMTWQWTRGHAGSRENERCHRLVVEARRSQAAAR